MPDECCTDARTLGHTPAAPSEAASRASVPEKTCAAKKTTTVTTTVMNALIDVPTRP